MKSPVRYSHLATGSSQHQHSGEHDEENREPKRRPQSAQLHWVFHILSLITSLICVRLYADQRIQNRKDCWREYNYYSPVNEALASIPYIETRLNGSLWFESRFKGPPSPDTDAAWQSLLDAGIFAVTASDLVKTGHNLTTAARFPDTVEDGYVSTTVGQHQLHCLHYIWQDHHRNYYQDVLEKTRVIPEMYERHYEHCVDYIRQSLMCSFDTGLVTYDWVLDHQNPTPNSNAPHKCVNWDRLQHWLKTHAVRIPPGFVWKQPDGQISLPWNP